LSEITLARSDRSPIRIWVIPSSSGEEPYSIAIYLLEQWAGINDWDVEIISSDIDTHMLAQARRGLVFRAGRSATAGALPAEVLQAIRRELPDSATTVRGAVEFTRVNLSERADTRAYRNFDVVFCRNLLIYFDDLSRKTAAETFYDALNPGGFILLGHSESMSRISSLYKVRKFPDAIVYQKPLEAR
jgi:chemotaxis protein methyltransferase CheR